VRSTARPIPGDGWVYRDLDETQVRATTADAGIEAVFRNRLIQRVHAYNAAINRGDTTKPYLDERLNRLDELEHTLYAWFETNKAGLRANPSAAGLFGLMNSIQQEHKTIIGARLEAGHGLWTADAMSVQDRAAIDTVWSDIVHFRGPFTVMERVHTATGDFIPLGPILDRFKIEILANLARLMSRPNGRRLIQAIHAGGDDKAIQFVMSPLYKILDQNYVGMKATAVVAAHATLGFAKGSPAPGPGSAAGVEIAPGVRDASLVDFDEAGELIPSPAFVGLGHELIHAAHYQRGTYSPGTDVDSLPPEYGGDLEEFLTIADARKVKQIGNQRIPRGKSKYRPTIGAIAARNAGLPTEAEIRAEHGLGIRHGHSTSANPTLHKSVDPRTAHDVGQFVKDPPTWLGNWPPPAQQAALPRAAPRPPAAAQHVAAAQQPAGAGTISAHLASVREWLSLFDG
jgi:hypothetical protein